MVFFHNGMQICLNCMEVGAGAVALENVMKGFWGALFTRICVFTANGFADFVVNCRYFL